MAFIMMTPSEIEENLAFFASLEFFGIKLGLDQTRELFRRLGDPQKNLTFIHVAGSNGKGSVCALLETALRRAGYRTGFFSSPHLVHPGERFKINGIQTAPETLAGYISRIRPAIRAMEQEGRKVTYFEAATVIAALIFADAKTDLVLWETGMGGRLDATSIVRPMVAVITGISLEHTAYLGETLEKIAFEKAGIIKEGVPVFCQESMPDAAKKVILARAEEKHAPCSFSVPPDPAYRPEISLAPDRRSAFQTFRLTDGSVLTTGLLGVHQRNNAALSGSVLKFLSEQRGFDYGEAVKGFAAVRWDARFQFFPAWNLLLDSAHNPEGIHALACSLREVFPGEKFHFLFGAFSDKDTKSSLGELAPLALSFRWIHMDDSRRASRTTGELFSELAAIAPDIPSCGVSLEQAVSEIPPDGAMRVLCGSLHLCGQALPFLQQCAG